MKWRWIILMAMGGYILILGILSLIIAIADWTWWILLVVVLGMIGISLLIGFIIVIVKLIKRKPEKAKLDVKEAKQRAINLQKYDNDNPDNFQIIEPIRLRVGERGTERTPVLYLVGRGTELNQERHVIINLNEPKEDPSILINPTENKIRESINKIVEHPPEEIQEERTIGTDEYGRLMTKIKTIRQSQAEKKVEEEEKKAEEVSGI